MRLSLLRRTWRALKWPQGGGPATVCPHTRERCQGRIEASKVSVADPRRRQHPGADSKFGESLAEYEASSSCAAPNGCELLQRDRERVSMRSPRSRPRGQVPQMDEPPVIQSRRRKSPPLLTIFQEAGSYCRTMDKSRPSGSRTATDGTSRRTFAMGSAAAVLRLLHAHPRMTARERSARSFKANQETTTRNMNQLTTKDGTQIYFKDWGSGPVVTFSHGWPLYIGRLGCRRCSSSSAGLLAEARC